MNRRTIPYIQLTSAMIIVGSSVVVGKLITNKFPVFLSQFISLVIALPFLVFLSIKLEGGFKPVEKKDLIILFLQSFTGIFLFRALILYGLKYTTASESGIIMSTTPAVLAIISFIFLKEKVTRNKIIGIFMVVLGIIMINSFSIMASHHKVSNTILGNSLILLAVIFEALFTIFRKVLSDKITPILNATYVTIFGILIFLPPSLYEAKDFAFFQYSIYEYFPIIYYGLIATVLAYMLWFQGVAQVETSIAAAYTGVMPVSSVFLSYIILKEIFSWVHIIGIMIIISGILFLSINQQKKLAMGKEVEKE